MEKFFKKILEDYPWSNLEKYWDHYELFLKKNVFYGGWKITGTSNQVKNTVNLIIDYKDNGEKM